MATCACSRTGRLGVECHREARSAHHGQVVGAVADCNALIGADVQQGRNFQQGAAFLGSVTTSPRPVAPERR